MALIESLGNAISGMLSQQTNIDVISNNIANVSTTGFKSQTVLFKDVFNKTIFPATPPTGSRGGTNPKQSGLGVTIAQIVNNMHQGAVQQDGINSHVLIQGNGFFVLKDAHRPTEFTRDGSFSLDRNNLLVNSDGIKVQGWTADDSGIINNSGPVSDIFVPVGQRAEASATTSIAYAGNLDASTPVGTRTATSTLSGSLDQDAAVGTRVTVSAGQWVDRSGVSHDVFYTLTKTADGVGAADGWNVQVNGIDDSGSWTGSVVPAAFDLTFDAAGAPTPASVGIGLGDQFGAQGVTVDVSGLSVSGAPVGLSGTADGVAAPPYETTVQVFDSEGTAHSMNLTLAKRANNTWDWAAEFPPGDSATTTSTGTLTFDSNGQPLTGTRPSVEVDLGNGTTTPQVFTLDFTGTSQLDAPDTASPPGVGPNSTLQARTQDGAAEGVLENFSIGQDGVITGFFTNGTIKAVGQLAVATFANAPGLIRTSGNNFRESPNSGSAIIGTADSGGAGVILSGALEQSNVDVTQEFTKMIVAQRAFQANSRVVSVSDDLLNEALSILRR